MKLETDFLVIGSGVAGLTFALKVAEFGQVTVVTKRGITDSSTAVAQGGIASVFDTAVDSFDFHIQDTLASGDGLCNEAVVAQVVKNGPDCIRELIDLGVHFNTTENPNDSASGLDLGREGGHSRKRIVHAHDMTGQEVERALVANIRQNDRITVLEDHIAIDLITRSTRMKRGAVITAHETECCGAYILDRASGQVKTVAARITLLATGGSGKVYLYTSNPDVATGDGIAMGYRAGASVANLEFVQFHPTCLYHPDAKNFLISEAVRGRGPSSGTPTAGPSWRNTILRRIWPAGMWWPGPLIRSLKRAATIRSFLISPTPIRILSENGFPICMPNVSASALI
ncbi:L-aspartate oxidase [Desulfonema ishimotonii]|uniref:L-aspartate oxidase n=1 Tax=Desulfonema ishimotonii TaxID=45657 RepID=A0A401G1U2_9BACT|nr:L-aspartate oxidase [Desulfonema ishimotonii]